MVDIYRAILEELAEELRTLAPRRWHIHVSKLGLASGALISAAEIGRTHMLRITNQYGGAEIEIYTARDYIEYVAYRNYCETWYEYALPDCLERIIKHVQSVFT